MEKLRILVFDDNELHRKAAVDQLGEYHDLVVVGTYDEAQKLLTPYIDKDKFKMLLNQAGFADNFNPYNEDVSKEKAEAYYEAQEKFNKEVIVCPDFDIVLTDLLVPASAQSQGPDSMKYVGQEMPLGTIIAFLAIKNGVKHVGVITDASHHSHPASAALDELGGYDGEPFGIGNVRILFASNFLNFGPKLKHQGIKNWEKAVEVLCK